jgi:hypothetical protein
VVAAGVELTADLLGAELRLNGAGIVAQRRFIADGKDADLLGREPEREISGVMLNEKPDEALVRAERGAVNEEQCQATVSERAFFWVAEFCSRKLS